jgi:prevent-host-death family protein
MNMVERAKQRTIKATELHRATSDVLKRAANRHEHIVVESDGYKVAVVLPYPDYEELIRQQARRDLDALLDESQLSNAQVSDEEVMADALKAQQEVRRAKRKKK